MAKDTHTQRQQTADNGRETKRKMQKIKLKRYRMHGWRWTDGQKDREQDKERERERQEEGSSGFTKDSARQWQLICMLYEDIITSGNFSFMRAHSAVPMSRQALLSRQLVHISPGNGLTERKGGGALWHLAGHHIVK